jgi:NAD(P)H-hydrate epimerase
MALMSEVIRLTRRQVREVDRRAIEVYGVPGIVLMENAARGVAEVAWEMIGRSADRHVMIFCGHGNNGGDGLAVARHLHNRGVSLELTFANAKSSTPDFDINMRIVSAMGLEMHAIEDSDIALWGEPDLVIDALLGTGASSPPRDHVKLGIEIIAGECRSPVLAIDLPSGLDCDTGEPLGPVCVHAAKTVTFVAEKAGFANPASRQYTGEVVIADIGCPKEIIDAVLREVPA